MEHCRSGLSLVAGFVLASALLAGASAQTQAPGVVGPLAGAGAVWGNAAAESAKIVAADVNAKGGLDVAGKMHKIEVVAHDGQYKAADALTTYSRPVTRDGVKLIMTVVSARTLALAALVEGDKNILIISASVEKAADPVSKQLFPMLSLLRDYVPEVVRWVKENRKERRVVIHNPNDESGWTSIQIARAAYGKHGFAILGDELYERALKDFQPLLTKVLAHIPEIIKLASTTSATSGFIVRQGRELGFEAMFVKNSGAAVGEILGTAGKANSEGVISQHFADPTSDADKSLNAEYRKSINQNADDLIAVYYDATTAVLQAASRAGTIDDTAKISEALFKKVFPMPSVAGGDIALCGNGKPGDPNQIIAWS